MSSNVILQQQVLSLLAQLIKLRVNYSLLDADQVSRVQANNNNNNNNNNKNLSTSFKTNISNRKKEKENGKKSLSS